MRPCALVCATVYGKNKFSATMCARVCDRVWSSVQPCAVKINFVRPSAVECASVYDRVRLCTAIFKQNVCAMMSDHLQ